MREATNALSIEDEHALRRLNGDISDVGEVTKASVREDFRYAYAIADRILDGSINPLNA